MFAHQPDVVVVVVSRPTEMNLLTDSEGIYSRNLQNFFARCALLRGLLERRPDRPAGRWSGVQTDQRPVVDLLSCGIVGKTPEPTGSLVLAS